MSNACAGIGAQGEAVVGDGGGAVEDQAAGGVVEAQKVELCSGRALKTLGKVIGAG